MGEYLAEMLSDDLRAMGHKVGSSTNGVTIEGELPKFWVQTSATTLYWDVTVEMELKLLVKQSRQEPGWTRVYSSKKTDRTYAWPTASLIENVANASVSDVINQIQSDTIWNSFTNDIVPKHISN